MLEHSHVAKWLRFMALALLLCGGLIMFGFFRNKTLDVTTEFKQLLASERPDIQPGEIKDGFLDCRMPSGQRSSVNLARIDELVTHEGAKSLEHRQEIYRRFVAVLDQASSEEKPLSLERHSARLFPRLVRKDFLDALRGARSLPSRPLPELGLHVAYVLDGERSVMFVNNEALSELGIDVDKLHEIAMDNLRKRPLCDAVRGAFEKGALINFKMMDSHDATRLLLLPECLNEGQALAACVPDRDTLVFMPAPADDNWKGPEELARIPLSDRLVLDRPIRVTRDGFEVK